MRQIKVNWNGVISYKEDNSYDIPEESGVYEILVKYNDGKYCRNYVGKTDGLRKRYFEHLSDSEENDDIREGVKKYNCGFDFALIDDVDDMADAEQGLYDKHNYSWNQQRPEGSGDEDYEIIESQ